KRLPDKGQKVSFGWSELDRLTGGLEKGSVVIIELKEHVPTSFIGMIERSLVANFAAYGRGVLWVPLKKASAEIARNQLIKIVDPSVVDKHVRILEVASQMERAPSPYIYQVEGSDAEVDLKWKNLSYSLNGSSSPYLSLMGFDTLESLYGEGVSNQVADHIASIRRNLGVMVGIVSPSTRSTEKLKDIATLYITIERDAGSLLVYGEEPFTECNVVGLDKKDDQIGVKLHPVE
ncbi:MAG TPA: hypothetical protein VLH13_05270, partial [Methanomassiliicoccales archaeon]|nr:hypothetical protein [Methanomassiliicoccales archaeon]